MGLTKLSFLKQKRLVVHLCVLLLGFPTQGCAQALIHKHEYPRMSQAAHLRVASLLLIWPPGTHTGLAPTCCQKSLS
jgi:hypothetical protein